MSAFLYDHEIVEKLLTTNEVLNKKDREELRKVTDESGLKKFHDKFGKEIRNVYSLWNTHNPNTFEFKTEKMIKQPSEVSYEVIVKTWEKLNETNE